MRTLTLALAACAAGIIAAGLAATAVAQSRPIARRSAAQPAPINPSTPIPFHGRLTDASGNAITGQVSITFALYKQPSGNTVLWTEQHSVTPQDGWFAVVLGDVTAGGNALPAWDGTELWLGVTVQGDAEMTPRTPILPAPAAAIANPTQHGETHEFGGSDEIGSEIATSHELVRSGQSGQIDPNWLPAAAPGTAGAIALNGNGQVALGLVPTSATESATAVPVVNPSTGKLDPSWLPIAGSGSYGTIALSSNNQIPVNMLPTAAAGTSGIVALNGSGQFALSLIPTSSTASSSAVPIAGGSGQLDPSWLPTATSSSPGVIALNGSGKIPLTLLPTSSTASSSAVPIASGTGKLDSSWLQFATSAQSTSGLLVGADDTRLSNARTPTAHASTHLSGGSDAIGKSTPGAGAVNALPYANSSGYLDNWIQQLPAAQGGTGTSAPKITRNLCFYNAGPSGSQQPTLMLPPDLSSCSATRVYASAMSGPSSAMTVGFYRNPSSASLIANLSWVSGALSAQASLTPVPLSAGDILYMVFSSSAVTNATTCVQVSCSYSFQ